MPRHGEVIVIGDANVDIIVHYPSFKNADRTLVEFRNPVMVGGGTASNTAHALGVLGVHCTFVGTVGDDSYGRFALADLAEAGVDVSLLSVRSDLNTVGVFAFVDERGERYLWGWPRENQSFKVIDESEELFRRARNAAWVHSSGMSLVYDTSARSTITRVFKEAYAAGVPTSFDLNLRVDDGVLDPDYSAALQEVLPFVTHLLGSGPDEYTYLGDGFWKDNARALSNQNRTVIARDGSRGCMAFTDAQCLELPAFKVVVEDTVGAGDDYNAGYIYAMLSGYSPAEALQYGNAVSGFAVAHKGARTTPNTRELEEFIKTHSSL